MKLFLTIFSFLLACELYLYGEEQNRQFSHCVAHEEAAEYVGGTQKMLCEISSSINALSDSTMSSGRIVLQFIVDKHGYVRHESIRVRKGVSERCDSAAINAIKKLGKFKPGRNVQGEIDDTWYTLPIQIGNKCHTYDAMR